MITYLVAASDAAPATKLEANYLCDGTDDHVEIQAAIDALSLSRVALSEGTFSIGNTITVPEGITLEGMGEQVTLVNLAAGVSPGISLTGGTKWTAVKNLRLWGNATPNTDGISISGSQVRLEGLYIRAFTRHGIYANNFVHLRLTDVYSGFNGGSGVYLYRAAIVGDSANNIFVEGGNYIGNADAGLKLHHTTGVLLLMVNTGVNASGVDVIGGSYTAIRSCWCESNTYGVKLRAGTLGIGRTIDANEVTLSQLVLYQNTTDIDGDGAIGLRIEDCRGSNIRLGSTVSEIIYDQSYFTTEDIDGAFSSRCVAAAPTVPAVTSGYVCDWSLIYG